MLVNKAVTSVTHCSKHKYKNMDEQSTQAREISSFARKPRGEREANFHALERFASSTCSAVKNKFPETITIKQKGLYLQHQYNTMLQILDKEAAEIQRYYEE